MHRYFPKESAAADYVGLAKISENNHDYKKMVLYAEKALGEPNINPIHKQAALGYLCVAIAKQINGPADVKRFNEAYERWAEQQEKTQQNGGLKGIVRYYHAKVNGRYAEALEEAQKINSLMNRLPFVSEAYALMGDYKNAYLTYREYKKISDSLNTVSIRQQTTESSMQLGVARAELEAHNSREHTRHVIIAMAGIIALIIILFLIFYLHRRRQQMNKLKTAYDQLETTTTAKERIDSELRIARDIQMGMVPSKFPAYPERNDIDLYALMVPAKEVGGDLYDFFLQGDRFYFCVGDVSGKGVPASMTMAVVVNLFRTVAKEGFPPEYVATKLNDTLSADNESGMFVTMFIGMIDLNTGRLDFCNCGHNPPMLGQHRAHTSQTVFRYIEMEPNAPIGLWPGLEFVGEHIDGVKDHSLFVYTDGVSEAENIDQEQFGERRMLRVLNESSQPFGERLPKSRSRYLVDRMKTVVEQFVGDAEQSDDLTMFCVQIK